MISSFLLGISLLIGLSNTAEDSLTFYQATEPGSKKLRHTDILQDNQGMFWISTNSQGILRYDGARTQALRHDPFFFGSLPANDIKLLTKSRNKGGIWTVSGSSGISYWDPQRERFRNYPRARPRTAGERHLAVEEDFTGRIWLLSDSGNIDVLNPKDDSVFRISHKNHLSKFLGDALPTSILAFENEWMLIGDSEGRNFRYNLDSGEFTSIPGPGIESAVLFHHRDRSGGIWMARENGLLYSYNKSSPSFHPLEMSGEVENCPILTDDFVSGPNGNFWYSSFDLENQSRLCELQPETARVRTIQLAGKSGDLITKGNIGSIEVGNHGSIWVASEASVWVADTSELTDMRTEDSTTGTAAISQPAKAPTTIITDFLLFGKSIRPEQGGYITSAPSTLEEIELPHHMNSIGFSFSTLDFRSPKENIHYYRLSPIQDHWTKTVGVGLSRAQFDALLPGIYDFEVRGVGTKGIESTSPVTIRIIIQPSWFMSWYAYAAYLIGLMSLFLSIIYIRTQRFNRSRKRDLVTIEKLKELDQMKTTVLTNMSHEIRTPLTSIIGYAELLEDAKNSEVGTYAKSISSGAKRLMRTLNSLLDLAQLQGNHIELRPVSNPLIKSIIPIIEGQKPIAIKNDVKLNFGRDTNNEIWALTDSIALERVLDNIITNAVKFTSGGEVTVDVLHMDAYAVVRVKDTGIGISSEFLPHIFEQFAQESDGLARNFEGNGVGLSIANHLVRLMDGRIEVKSKKGLGSTFSVYLPLGSPPLGYHKKIIDGGEKKSSPTFVTKTGHFLSN